MKNITQQIKVIFLGLAIAAGFSYAYAWNGPGNGVTPPASNTAAPLNVDNGIQTKLGSLILNAASPIQNAIGLTVFGNTNLYGLTLSNGSQGKGKVLQSDISGNATWVSTSSLGISGGGGGSTAGVSQIVAGTNITISPTSGTGAVTISTPEQVNGGCYLGGLGDASNSFTPKYTGWGNATGGTGIAANGGCTCPSGWTVQSTGRFLTSGIWYNVGYICII